MIPFFLIFFILYGGMHLYAFIRARAAFAFSTPTGIVVALFMIIMIFAPVLIRLSERAGLEIVARFMSYIGYTWLGVVFLFVSVTLVVDAYRFFVYSAQIILKKDFSSVTISDSYAFLIPLSLAITISVYGYFEALNIRTELLTIKSPKIPVNIGRVRIVQISDVHLGLIVGEERLKNIVKNIQAAEPDILVSTGDLVDGQLDNLTGLAGILKEVKTKYGKYAITGNHEFYAGITQALHFTEQAGFTMLRGEGLTVPGLITIAGVDDPQAKSFGSVPNKTEKELLSGFPRDRFTLFLKHRPFVDKNALGLFDLQLSGHVHRGQIFPFSIITGLYYPVQAGFAELTDNSKLYVSRGCGTWGPPIRFMSPPEVTVIDLVHESQ
jgi:uncharacterized protein